MHLGFASKVKTNPGIPQLENEATVVTPEGSDGVSRFRNGRIGAAVPGKCQ